jgi:hypothetical protein
LGFFSDHLVNEFGPITFTSLVSNSIFQICAIFIIVFPLSIFYAYLALVRQMKKMTSKICRFRFTDDLFYVQSDLGSSQLKWVAVSKLNRYKKMWLLFIGGGTFLMVPTDQLDVELQQFLQGKVVSKRSYADTLRIIAFWLLVVTFVCAALSISRHKASNEQESDPSSLVDPSK